MDTKQKRLSAKQKYEVAHGIRNPGQFGETDAAYGASRPTNQIHTNVSGQSDGNARRTNQGTSGDGSRQGSIGERDWSQREYDGAYEPGGGSFNQDTSASHADVGGRTAEELDFAPDQSRIINVATVPQKRGRGRPPKPKDTKPEKAPEIRAVVVDVLKGPEVEATRARLRSAFVGVFKATDEFINLTLKNKPEEPVQIWSAIDDADIDVLVNARISNAQKSVLEARVVRAFITVYEQFATGFILLPRVWQTIDAYHMYEFQLPGADMLPKNRKRRNLRVVDAERPAASGGGTN